ncbi:sensor histidine kinase [Bacillus sp. AFS055030]|uniref:sensor histidine kinase n=1 Tax=Bacillus sp. AFS055030 TaxID=2033507 RepID=UPI000BFC491B|nr:sensor histidine kinase [Bacillus sp. AFS055030]PGL67806.1 two-component sensor histidine kinase [Bacillus sp. AFS055030]
MKIRTKLFIFIPILVILLNLVSFFIFENSKKVQESYNLMINKIFLYKQISTETQENLNLLSSYIINPKPKDYRSILQHRNNLQNLKKELLTHNATKNNQLVLENFTHMIDSFLELESSITDNLVSQNFSSYTEQYRDIEKIAGFIREDSQNLVDLELSHYQPIFQKIINNTESMNKLGVQLFIITTIISIVFAVWLSRSIVIPINRLVYMAKQIGKGNFNVEPPTLYQKNEIGILGKILNEMSNNLRNLMIKNIEIVEKERLVKELELKALQSQINPHFLFNTLNVISKLAYIEGAEQTSDLTVSTSNLLRYNLRKLDEPVCLMDEIRNAKEYFSIQKARFRDRVRFELNIEESCLQHKVPCLTLQPLLENAFIHGIEGMERDAVIGIDIKSRENYICIQIYDNGAGMSEDTKNALLTSTKPIISQKGSTGLGTTNVFKRWRLFYGEEEIVDIKSDINKGTTIILKLPVSL